ncbi:FCD domain-containing protein [Sphaerisporangium sp. NPDC051011]|uniref:FadR/GntR family transcriptional regulator n=1 Tax=Sphaerisporangium sp. NPDC051011 TaxID=3155792 RepID=UPI0033E4A700
MGAETWKSAGTDNERHVELPGFRRADWTPAPAGAQPTRPAAVANALEVMAQAEPGLRLGTKDELRAHFGVSVGTFNEALRIAQGRGVVTVRRGPGGGLFARRQSPLMRLGSTLLTLDEGAAEFVADALRLRKALDPLVMEDAVAHATASDVEELRAVVRRMEAAVRDADIETFARVNWSLHARIAEISRSPLLRTFYLSLIKVLESQTLEAAPADAAPETAPEDSEARGDMAARCELHARLVETVARHDRDEALAVIKEHNDTDNAVVGAGRAS